MTVDLSSMGLSQADLDARRHFIGGSDATIIAKGDPEAVNRLARFKRGLEPPEDLSGSLPVMLGTFTEPFNLAWAERELAVQFEKRGVRVTHPDIPYMVATLDAWNPALPGPVNAKHTNAFNKASDLVDHYCAQMHHEMLVTGAQEGMLSVIYGNHKFEVLRIKLDPYYAGELAELEKDFWAAVQEGRDPHPVALPPPPVAFDEMIEVDMTGDNEFAVHAASWISHRDAAKLFSLAEKALKDGMPAEAKRSFGYGVEITRNKKGAKSIRVMESANE